MTTEKSCIGKKEKVVIRFTDKDKHYLKTSAGVGNRFNKDKSDDVWNIVDGITEKHTRKKGMFGDNILCHFDTEEDAKQCLIKIYQSYYKKHKNELPEGYIEIVKIIVSVEEKVLNKYDFDALDSLGASYTDVMEDFESYFVKTAFAVKSCITFDDMEKKRKTNLTGYTDEKINNFFHTWCELNDK